MQLKRTVFNRSQIKSSEGEFIYEMENSYELSPKLSQQILLTAKECLLKEYNLREGQIEITVVSIEERAGKIIEKLEKKKVRLTIDNGIEDLEVKKGYGRIGLRRIKIQRISDEAIEQEGVLSQEDISKYLSCTVRTIQRDIREIKKEGIEVITRGYLHNIGRGQTHKIKIIGMYLDGKTYSEIKILARHSLGAIKRYLESFIKVVMCYKRRIYQNRDISAVTGLSQSLVNQYVDLIKQSKKDKIRRENLQQLTERAGYREGIKKTVRDYSKPLAAMTGDLS